MVFRHIDGSVFIFISFLWPVFMGRLSGSLGGLDRSHTCRAPLGGGRVYGGTGLVLFAIHVSEFWVFGGPTVLGINPPAASFCLRLATSSSALRSGSSLRESFFFFCPPSTPCGMMLGSRIPGLSAFAGSSFLSVLRISAALGCVGVLGLGLLRR